MWYTSYLLDHLETTSGEEKALRPDDMLCFELHAASRAMTAVYRPLLKDLGLTYPQYLVMVLLWEREPRLVNDLGRALELDSGTLSPLLKRLEASGLILRRRRQTDERELEVTLAEAGEGLRDRARHVPKAVEQATGLTPGEMEELVGKLAGLRASLYRALPE